MEITSLSYSKINSLLYCARAFEYNYVKKKPIPLRGRMLAGRCYHHALAIAESKRQIFNEILSPSDIGDAFSDHWDREVADKRVYDELGEEQVEATIVDFGDDDPNKLKDSGIRLAQIYSEVILPTLEIVSIERRLTADVDGVSFVGYIDLELKGDIIADHKLRRRRMGAEEIARDMQATSYCLLYGRPIRFQFHQAIDAKEKGIEIGETTRGQEEGEWLRVLVGDAWRQIQAGIFPPNPTWWGCNPDCPYYLDCRKGWF